VGRGSEALALLEGEPFDFILSDVIMPEMGGLDLLRAVKEKKVQATVIMMSAYGNLDTAVEAMKLGAYDYVSKPFKPDEILLTLRKAEERSICGGKMSFCARPLPAITPSKTSSGRARRWSRFSRPSRKSRITRPRF